MLAVIALLVAWDVAFAIWRDRIALLVVNARYGCFPWSPAEVPFTPGMVICPGQTATVDIIVHFRPSGDDI